MAMQSHRRSSLGLTGVKLPPSQTHYTHTRTCVLSVGLSSLRAKLKTIQYDTQENVQIHTLVNVHGSLLGSCSF